MIKAFVKVFSSLLVLITTVVKIKAGNAINRNEKMILLTVLIKFNQNQRNKSLKPKVMTSYVQARIKNDVIVTSTYWNSSRR